MTGEYSARVTFPNSKEPDLDVDFEPIINFFNLLKLEKFVLCHWQSRPKGIRGYGFYDKSLKYHCIDWDNILIEKCLVNPLQIDESIHKTSIVAALLFPNTKLIKLDDKLWTIK